MMAQCTPLCQLPKIVNSNSASCPLQYVRSIERVMIVYSYVMSDRSTISQGTVSGKGTSADHPKILVRR